MDFSGSWEMDYSQSDNIQTKLDSMVRELRRQAERRSQGGNQGAIMVGGSGRSEQRAVYHRPGPDVGFDYPLTAAENQAK